MANSMIMLAAFLVLAAVAAIEALPSGVDHSEWSSYKAQYGKEYGSPAEEAKRLELFAQKKLAVDEFNQQRGKDAGYRLAVNHLSDRTEEEFRQLLGFKMAPSQLEQGKPSKQHGAEFLSKLVQKIGPVPDSVDWRERGYVSPVKDQGGCGSCWAFAAAGVLEGRERIQRGLKEAISLSAQNIMDCGSFSKAPCNGGDIYQALLDVTDQSGVQSESSYPYTATGGSCKFNKSLALINSVGAFNMKLNNETILKIVVAGYGPVAVAINVREGGDFMSYQSGVFTDKHCRSDYEHLNHAVLVVGYGTDPEGGDYWLVKNSWSQSWGEEGYIRMARNRQNMCGIASYNAIPIA